MTPPLREEASEYCHEIWYRKTRMVWLPDGEKKFEDLFILLDRIHERDRQTDGHRMTARTDCACIASSGKKVAAICHLELV